MFRSRHRSGVTGALVASATFLAACRGSDVSGPFTERAIMASTAVVAKANTPDRTVTDISRGPIVLFGCDGFNAIATFSGTVATTVFYDASGNATRLINQYHTNSVISNSVTGKQILGSSRGPDHVDLLPNGDELVASSGLLTNFRGEDGTHLIFATGHVIQIFRADGSVETTFVSGNAEDYLGSRRTQICNALAG